jgi:folylpolyglutamate synthase/dihydropteroate synthase
MVDAAHNPDGARALEAAQLAALVEAAGVRTEVIDQPEAALERAATVARERGGVALVTGSHYLLPYAWTARRAQSSCT